MNTIPDNQIRVLEKQTIECRDVEDLMCDYADGELTESLKERLDIHCVQCEPCLEMRDSYLEVVNLAKELKEAPLPKGVETRLREALNKKLGLNLSVS